MDSGFRGMVIALESLAKAAEPKEFGAAAATYIHETYYYSTVISQHGVSMYSISTFKLF
jgi:hypothetical protein